MAAPDSAMLDGCVALVTGASRGVGRGAARGLLHAGATVYASGRSIESADLDDGIVRVTCDHTDDEAVARLFRRVETERGRLDVLVNNAWGGYERMVEGGKFTWPAPFWEQPAWRWDAMMNAGVRAAFLASQRAACMMVAQRSGLIVNVSHWAAQKRIGNAIYGVAKAATDKLTADTAVELREHGVTVVSLYPGLVRTEAVLAAGFFDLSNSESPEFQGRAVAALAGDPQVERWTGQVLVTAALAEDYGFADVDGNSPRPLTLADV
ncbi:MAG: SDR family NAD(P)-dependent oxidoreductase [Acidobacteria bacterium]|nr:SDR family NAD(P)-dependent oxidoreductase [Acidobacteriota bacterium]